MSWGREDQISLEREYSAMIEAVTTAADSSYVDDTQTALAKVAILRRKETGEIHALLGRLYDELSRPHKNTTELNQLIKLLSEERDQIEKK